MRIAAAPSIKPAAAPLVTSPASAPVASAMTRATRPPAVRPSGTDSAGRGKNASSTASGIGAPPRRVTAPEALMIGSRPHSR